MKKRRSVLVIEDDPDIAGLVELHLRDLDCATDIAADGTRGLEFAESNDYDLIVLDLMLPGLDGLEICKRVRAGSRGHVPILMLTAKSTELDRILGLEVGADDYLTKPFSILELVARAKALFRRVEQLAKPDSAEPESITHADLSIDRARRRVTVAGHQVQLTAKEFDLLYHFASHPGRVFTRSQLLDEVWGYAHEGYEHTVNSHINRLRAKIEPDPARPRFIETVWGRRRLARVHGSRNAGDDQRHRLLGPQQGESEQDVLRRCLRCRQRGQHPELQSHSGSAVRQRRRPGDQRRRGHSDHQSGHQSRFAAALRLAQPGDEGQGQARQRVGRRSREGTRRNRVPDASCSARRR
ncbi:MAG: response regulator transcription factor [bacterium]|nr:response regulator transcription factor [bacterium]